MKEKIKKFLIRKNKWLELIPIIVVCLIFSVLIKNLDIIFIWIFPMFYIFVHLISELN